MNKKIARLLLGPLFFMTAGLPGISYSVSAVDDFNPNPGGLPWIFGGVLSIAVQADGKVLVGGMFDTMGGVAINGIARVNPDGSLDTGFNPNPTKPLYSSVSPIIVQADGKILVGGNFTTMGGVTRNYIARLNPDGSLDTGFNPNSGWDVASIAVQADGKILVGGNFTTMGGVARNGIARLNPDGSLDPGFNPNATPQYSGVSSIAVQADGKILVGGKFATMGGVARNGIARLNPDASLDPGFNPNPDSRDVHCIVVQADGKILVGGMFTTIGGVARNGIARLNP